MPYLRGSRWDDADQAGDRHARQRVISSDHHTLVPSLGEVLQMEAQRTQDTNEGEKEVSSLPLRNAT